MLGSMGRKEDLGRSNVLESMYWLQRTTKGTHAVHKVKGCAWGSCCAAWRTWMWHHQHRGPHVSSLQLLASHAGANPAPPGSVSLTLQWRFHPLTPHPGELAVVCMHRAAGKVTAG